jgi:hypothetical protein
MSKKGKLQQPNNFCANLISTVRLYDKKIKRYTSVLIAEWSTPDLRQSNCW